MPTETYHLPPNFTIHPPPKGPIHLGTILNNLQEAEAINEDCRLEVPGDKISHFSREGFTATVSQARQGKCGIWAKFLSLTGVGGEASVSYDPSHEYEIKCDREDQITFTPTTDFLQKSMKEEDIVDWLSVNDDAPVYLVTGLKIARAGTNRALKSTKKGFTTELGIQQPDLGIAVGPSVTASSEKKSEQAVEKSQDYIVGIRVQRLVYRKAWLSSHGNEKLEAKAWNYGASLLDGSKSEDEYEVIEVPEDMINPNYHTETENVEGSVVEWIVPNA